MQISIILHFLNFPMQLKGLAGENKMYTNRNQALGAMIKDIQSCLFWK